MMCIGLLTMSREALKVIRYMKESLDELKKHRWYLICLGITIFLSYCFFWTHPAMGVDDTCVQRYFADGFAPTQGRWTIFLLNKIFHVAEFSPFIVDFIGTAFVAAAAVVLSLLFSRLSGGKITWPALTVFSCLMVSYPLIGEVFVYYLHNGIGLAYLLTAGVTSYMVFEKRNRKYLAASLVLTAALSCYESFAMVYVLCIALAIFVQMYFSEQEINLKKYIKVVFLSVIPLICAMILRSVIADLICAALGKNPNMFSLASAVQWLFSPNILSSIKGMISLFGRYYIVNGLANFGVAIYLISAVFFGVMILVITLRQRKPVFLLNGLVILLSPWLLSFLQGTVTPYRSMQALPIFVGFAGLIFISLCKEKPVWVRGILLPFM